MDRRAFLTTSAMTTGLAATTGMAFPESPSAGAAWGRGNRYGLQRRFVDWRFGMFLHFNMGTFHDAEWVEPGQDPGSFDPAGLDCGQWADAARAARMRFAVLTAKHHDGFCLWPSRYTSYSVAASPLKRDVVREYMHAFRARGITPCLYLTPVSATDPAAVDGHSDFGWDGQADQTLATLDGPVTLDLGRVFTGIDALTYLPRQDTETPYSFERFVTAGNITGYRVSAGLDGTSFRTVARGRWAPDHTLKQVRFRRPVTAGTCGWSRSRWWAVARRSSARSAAAA